VHNSCTSGYGASPVFRIATARFQVGLFYPAVTFLKSRPSANHVDLRSEAGLVGTLLYVGLSVLGLGYEIHWTYRTAQSTGLEHQVVATGIITVAALSVIGLVLAQMEGSLWTGRLFGISAVLLTAMVATFEGALRGVFGTE